MRALPMMLTFAACNQWVDFPEVPGPGDISAVVAGSYMGSATVELRAYAGPVLARRETCVTPVSVDVDQTADWLLTGEFSCEFEETPTLDADFIGASAGLPDITGVLDADRLVADWDGWFTDADSFYADMTGRQTIDGLRVEYRGFVLADRTGPLSGPSLGG